MAEGLASPFLSYLESLELCRVPYVLVRSQGGNMMSTLASWNFKALKTLRFVGLGLTEMEGIMLAKVLSNSHFPALQCLDLKYNELGVTGFKALFQAFKSGEIADLEYFTCSAYITLNFPTCKLAEVLLDGHLPKLKSVSMEEHEIINQEAADALVHAYQNNPFLTAKLEVLWPVGPWEDNWKGFCSRNEGQVEDLRKLDGARVSAKQGRVFLCGEPCAGKTTLRKSLSKRHTKEAWCSVARRLCLSAPAEDEPRTRGIEVVQIADEEVTLTLWDLAGQREYHVLHGAFFPDLAYTDVYATIFVVVCRANPETSFGIDDKSYEDLRYCLRFIAASSLRGVEGMKRQVILVLNRFHNMQCDDNRRNLWKLRVEDFRKEFTDFLEITFEMDSCCLDVRASNRAERLKQMMFQKTKGMLKGKRMPKACENLQSAVQQWATAEEHKLFPVLDWDDILRQVNAWGKGLVELSNETLVAAINYLNQVGVVIYFSEGICEDGGLSRSDLIVVQPEWFCRDVVGDLLLPEELWGCGKEILLHKRREGDHTLTISTLKEYYTKLNDAQVSAAITILLRMGLCFSVGSTKVLIPALVPVNTPLPSWWTERRHCPDHDDQWVMGFSLIPVDAQRTLLPSFFSRFQVELAQETEIRQQVGNDFSVGSRFVAFKALGMEVLVEFRAEEKNAMTDRVYFMVKPSLPKRGDVVSGVSRGEPSLHKIDDDVSSRAQQVNFAYSLLEKLDGVVRRKCCPGVQFQRAVMKPWSARDGHHPMMKRNVDVLVDNLKKELASPDLKPETALTEWYVGGVRVRKAELLSERDLVHAAEELQRAVGTMREGIKVSLALVEALGASNLQRNGLPLPSPELGRILSMPGPGSIQMGGGFSGDAQLRFILDLKAGLVDLKTAFVDMKARVQVLEIRAKEVKKEVQELRTEQTNIANQLRILEITFLEEKHNSVPRFVHFTESKSKDWMRLRDVLNVVTPCTLHVLCEARFDDGELHEIENQKGLDVSRMKEWAKKYAKWIKWCITIFGAITSIGAAAIPGFGVLAPAICSGATQIATSAIDQIKEWAMITSSIEASLTAGQPIKDLAKLALEELPEGY